MGLLFFSSNPTTIYSNYPEEIPGNSMGDHYTIEASLQANIVYTLLLRSSLQEAIAAIWPAILPVLSNYSNISKHVNFFSKVRQRWRTLPEDRCLVFAPLPPLNAHPFTRATARDNPSPCLLPDCYATRQSR